jgi:hypothetical protein
MLIADEMMLCQEWALRYSGFLIERFSRILRQLWKPYGGIFDL